LLLCDYLRSFVTQTRVTSVNTSRDSSAATSTDVCEQLMQAIHHGSLHTSSFTIRLFLSHHHY